MFIRRLPKFDYHSPLSVADAVAALERLGDDARPLAGGTDLLVAMKRREQTPRHLVNLKAIPSLRGVTCDDAVVRLGALTTLRDLERSEIVRTECAVLADAVSLMASAQVRTLATIGGNLCSAIPSADTAPPLIALGASLVLVGPGGERRLAAEHFFSGPRQTVLARGELLTAIIVPRRETLASSAYLKLMRRHAMDLALVGVAACLTLEPDGATCRDARIALGAVGPTPLRVPAAEAVLRGRGVDEAMGRAAGKVAGAQCRPITDIRASLDYRCSMVEVLLTRAIAEARKRIVV